MIFVNKSKGFEWPLTP